MPSSRVLVFAVTSLLLAFTAACGDDGEPSSTPGAIGPTGATVPTGTTGSSPTGGAPIGRFEDVQAGVIQIIARGTFRDPEVGLSHGSGSGSGFIVSPNGLAVTNNRVVAGAATLEVFVGGDTTRSYNARIVGVSECNDLAVIDIEESEPLPYLQWYEDEIVPGIDVYAAGFPLGDPQFTLTRGIVSKAEADGDITGTSSIDHTIEHDANMQPGSSGGPLVAANGRVVGVNYAGGVPSTTAPQFFAIASELAKPVVERLKEGDYEALGINGWAVLDEDAGLSGVWIAGIAAGSPASRVGLMPGDVIRAMNGLPVGTDGTLADYCDVMRTAGDRAISIEVLRYDSGEVLRGEINGDKPLTVVYSPAEDLAPDVSGGQAGSATSYADFVTIWDETNSITVDVPEEWQDIAAEPFELEGEQIPYVAAAPDLDGFFNTYETSGMEFAVFSPQDDLEATVDIFAPDEGDCEDRGYLQYDDGFYKGVRHVWGECGENGTLYVVLAAVPIGVAAEQSFTAVLLAQLTVEADIEALDRMFATFDVQQ